MRDKATHDRISSMPATGYVCAASGNTELTPMLCEQFHLLAHPRRSSRGRARGYMSTLAPWLQTCSCPSCVRWLCQARKSASHGAFEGAVTGGAKWAWTAHKRTTTLGRGTV